MSLHEISWLIHMRLDVATIRHFRRFWRRTAIITVCVFAISRSALAHDSEPINTDFASPLTRGTANLNFDLAHFRSAAGEDLAGIDFEYGFARRMQFSVRFSLARSVFPSGRSAIGAGNLAFQYRYLLAGGNEKPFAISVNPEAGFPTGNPGIADRGYRVGGAIHIDTHRGDKLWLHSNLGYETPVAHFQDKDKEFYFAVAGMYEVTERLHSVLEIFGSHDFNSSVSRTFVAPELIYALGEHWELKAAVPFGATSSTPDVGIQMRVTWKIGSPARQ